MIGLTVNERIAMILLSEKLNKNLEYSNRIGVTAELVSNEDKPEGERISLRNMP